ncbi:hypothetical protein [Pseudochryseolinea flava]|uniref:Uncharacterized protein n=1 Tax=Pseudochryseolinea flava TaxID=2059302 RepID=A0A364Y6R6_9BACT|nr:hypothetical protein [Pseudochryseolinea flava]RAW02794.1 hypothetical protein DQQ10_01415 [Pseudochryseolinea flava]
MSTDARTQRLHFLENVSHYLTAFVVIMKGVAKLENPDKLAFSIFFIIVGILIALGTLFHHKFEHLIKNFKAYVFLLESIVIALVGYLYLKEGKQGLPYVCFFASLAFLISMVVHFVKGRGKSHAQETK